MRLKMDRCILITHLDHAELACLAEVIPFPQARDLSPILLQIAIVLEYMNGGSLGDVLQKVPSASYRPWARCFLSVISRNRQ